MVAVGPEKLPLAVTKAPPEDAFGGGATFSTTSGLSLSITVPVLSSDFSGTVHSLAHSPCAGMRPAQGRPGLDGCSLPVWGHLH